jgi:hypothetical protein
MAVSVEPRPVQTVVPEPLQVPPPAILEARSVDKVYDTGKVRIDALRGVDLVVPHGKADESIPAPKGCGSLSPDVFHLQTGRFQGARRGAMVPSWTPGCAPLVRTWWPPL